MTGRIAAVVWYGEWPERAVSDGAKSADGWSAAALPQGCFEPSAGNQLALERRSAANDYLGADADQDSSFDRHADHTAPFCPRTVVYAYICEFEQFGHRETC